MFKYKGEAVTREIESRSQDSAEHSAENAEQRAGQAPQSVESDGARHQAERSQSGHCGTHKFQSDVSQHCERTSASGPKYTDYQKETVHTREAEVETGSDQRHADLRLEEEDEEESEEEDVHDSLAAVWIEDRACLARF